MRKLYRIILLIIMIAILLWVYYLFNGSKTIYCKKINNINEQLDNSMIEWIEKKNLDKSIYLYSVESESKYEILLYYNEEMDKNNYITLRVNAKIIKNTLKIYITKVDAVDDKFVNNYLATYIKSKKEPKDIEVYIDGKKKKVNIEKGNNKILKITD